MNSGKKRQKNKHHIIHNSNQLEIRIPRVLQFPLENHNKTVKVSHLTSCSKQASLKMEENDESRDELKHKLDVYHTTLFKNNELLRKASDSIKLLDVKKLRKEIEESNVLDTAQCLLEDSEKLGEDEQELSKNQQPIKKFGESLSDILKTLEEVKQNTDVLKSTINTQ